MKNAQLACTVLCSLTISSISRVTAGEAFFSPDGKTVTLVMKLYEEELAQVNVETGKYKPIPLPGELKKAAVESVAAGAEGEVLFLAAKAVWVLKGAEAARKVCSVAPVEEAQDLFVVTKADSPMKDWLFVSGVEKPDNAAGRKTFFARKPGGKTFGSIFCRRVEDAVAGTFGADGRFFFMSSGDVWEGGVEPPDDGDERLGTLVGARLAPLATLNTDEANGGGMWVDAVAPAGKWLYAKLHGHHMAAIVRTPLPTKPLYSPTQQEMPSVKQNYQAMSQSLGKAEVIVDDAEDIAGFCACEVAGKPRLFYVTRSGKEDLGPDLMLWEGAGAPRVIGNAPKAR